MRRLHTRNGIGCLLMALAAFSFAEAALAESHEVTHVFTIEDVQGGFDGSTVGTAGRVTDPSIVCGAPIAGSPACPVDAAQPVMDSDGDLLFPVDSEFGFNVVDFLGAQPKTRDGDYGEGFVATVQEEGEDVGLKLSNAATEFYKVRPPLGTWCAGLGGNTRQVLHRALQRDGARAQLP